MDVRQLDSVPDDADVVSVPVSPDGLADAPHPDFLAGCGFTGRVGQTVPLPPAMPGTPARIVVGVGDGGGPDGVRRAAAAVARATQRYQRVALDLGAVPAATALEGFLLAGYRFGRHKSTSAAPPSATARLDLIGGTGSPGATADVVAAVCLARDLGNEPGGTLTPPEFADRAAAIAAAAGLECQVWDERRIADERLGGLLGVSRGSAQPPRLVRLGHRPGGATGTVALVGKGVTFDAGGLTLKPNQFLLDMKIDMAGAAAVLAAMTVLPSLACPVEVHGWLPLTDNMLGGDATRLGDVLRTRNGTTVEVRNADAEGRLILADALALACEHRPDAVVDVATLTDTVPMAIGRRCAGLAGNHDDWTGQVAGAAERAGEQVWTLPLDDRYRPMLDSKIADLVNATGNRYGQSALAAMFLREFVTTGTPWAHLDIAGPAFCDEDDGEWTAGATGYGVRTLVELLRCHQPL